jgi:hypothetical protein
MRHAREYYIYIAQSACVHGFCMFLSAPANIVKGIRGLVGSVGVSVGIPVRSVTCVGSSSLIISKETWRRFSNPHRILSSAPLHSLLLLSCTCLTSHYSVESSALLELPHPHRLLHSSRHLSQNSSTHPPALLLAQPSRCSTPLLGFP